MVAVLVVTVRGGADACSRAWRVRRLRSSIGSSTSSAGSSASTSMPVLSARCTSSGVEPRLSAGVASLRRLLAGSRVCAGAGTFCRDAVVVEAYSAAYSASAFSFWRSVSY